VSTIRGSGPITMAQPSTEMVSPLVRRILDSVMLRDVKTLGPLGGGVLILWALAGEGEVVAVRIGAGLRVPPRHEPGTPLLRSPRSVGDLQLPPQEYSCPFAND